MKKKNQTESDSDDAVDELMEDSTAEQVASTDSFGFQLSKTNSIIIIIRWGLR